VPKLAATVYTQGKKVYWDPGVDKATETAAALKQMGYVYKAALSGDATVLIYLSNDAIV